MSFTDNIGIEAVGDVSNLYIGDVDS